jgi:hypothetical protein
MLFASKFSFRFSIEKIFRLLNLIRKDAQPSTIDEEFEGFARLYR